MSASQQFQSPEYVAIGYVTDAKRYLRAATILTEHEDGIILFSPTYFLLCHTMELLLKAFMLARGKEEQDLRAFDVRHSLGKLRDIAVQLGLSVNDHTSGVIDMLAPYPSGPFVSIS